MVQEFYFSLKCHIYNSSFHRFSIILFFVFFPPTLNPVRLELFQCLERPISHPSYHAGQVTYYNYFLWSQSIWAKIPQSTRKKPTTSEFAETCWQSTRRFKNNILLKIFFFFFKKIFMASSKIFYFSTLNSWTTWHGSNSVNFWPI